TLLHLLCGSLPEDISERVMFETVSSHKPLEYILSKAAEELGSKENAGDLLVTGRHVAEKSAASSIRQSLIQLLSNSGVPSGVGNDTRRCLGDIAEAAIVSGLKASVLVMQGRSV